MAEIRNGIGSLASKEIREEIEALVDDPIIRELARELIRNGDGGIDTSGWTFMMGAYNEYKARGGMELRTLGAPANAIKMILDREAT